MAARGLRVSAALDTVISGTEAGPCDVTRVWNVPLQTIKGSHVCNFMAGT